MTNEVTFAKSSSVPSVLLSAKPSSESSVAPSDGPSSKPNGGSADVTSEATFAKYFF